MIVQLMLHECMQTNVLAYVEARLCCNVRMANNFLNSEDIAGLLVSVDVQCECLKEHSRRVVSVLS